MRVAVYLPLLLPLLAAVSARWLAGRLAPRAATWLLTVTALVLAVTSGLALTALAATAIGQIPLLATLGDWSVRILRRDDPASLSLAVIASLALALALGAAGRTMIRRAQGLLDAARTAHRLPTDEPGGWLVVLDDPYPDAYALPGVPGRIVVSTGMLDALDDRERQALVAHERTHLACGHHLFLALAALAAATNPLLRPVAAAIGFTTERWADECAATAVGDRRAVAQTIAKAALLISHHHARPTGALPIVPPLATPLPAPLAARLTRARAAIRWWRAGPVPRRVAALLVAPPHHRRLLLILTVAVLVLAAAASVEAARDLEALFDLAQLGG
jgi:Zn-dependent protease with chaperone function